MGVVRPRVSYADLERAPEDGRRYELYDGEVFVVPSPLPDHQLVAQAIFKRLDQYAQTRGGLVFMAPLDIVFSNFDVIQPDVLFFQASRRHLVPLRAVTRAAPDLAVEVLSPSTAATDRGKKMHLLARYDVPEYWIVDPASTSIEVYSLSAGGYVLACTASGMERLRSPLLPDFVLMASEVFPLAI